VRRVTLRTLIVCLSACGLGAGVATAISLPGGVPTAAGSHLAAKPTRFQTGTAPNLPAPPRPTALSAATADSYNWSGYAATSTTDQYFTQVEGAWQVPTVTCTPEDRIASLWVGLDGWNDSTVEQEGTEAQCFQGKAVYFNWYEMYPAGTVEVGSTVHPGDIILAAIARTGTSYNLQLVDLTTTGNNINVTKSCALTTCLDTSAEWIIERPDYTSTGIAPLAQYTPITFAFSSASGGTIANGSISKFSPTQIEMIDSTDTYLLETTGALNSAGTGFSDGWINSY
jgi:hypothetical protein